ncbi:MAG: DUF1178 family protein [Deltaproteobacteria bacterium]|nr:DUF1178 family protein [Deltaproteobacteria bacterium]
MIAFDLQCANGHTFEGWFEDGQAYQNQRKKGQIACPVCDDTSVSKIPSSFAVKASQTTPDSYGHDAELLKIGNKMVDYVKKNFDDVGCEFAKEALKIHYGVSEPRNIRGVSTDQEEKTLKDEGIKFFKIPMPATPDTDT